MFQKKQKNIAAFKTKQKIFKIIEIIADEEEIILYYFFLKINNKTFFLLK